MQRSQQRDEEDRESAVLARTGEGQRQYLTGLRTGGRRILILLDTSASMLARNIVNIVRLRNMAPQSQRSAPKWRQAVGTVEWLAAQMPAGAQFQLYGFGVDAEPVVAGSAGRWLEIGDGKELEAAMDRVREIVPSGGTSLRGGARSGGFAETAARQRVPRHRRAPHPGWRSPQGRDRLRCGAPPAL